MGVDGRLGVEALHGTDGAEGRVVRRLKHAGGRRMGAGEVADEVEVLSLRGGDAKGLLDEAVWLVAVAIGAICGGGSVAAVGVMPGIGGAGHDGCILCGSGKGASSSLALHLAVGEEAARDAAGTPGLAVGPPPHTSLTLVPDEDGARLDLLTLLLGQATLDARQMAQSACLEEDNGVGGSSHLAGVRLHGADGGDNVSRRWGACERHEMCICRCREVTWQDDDKEGKDENGGEWERGQARASGAREWKRGSFSAGLASNPQPIAHSK